MRKMSNTISRNLYLIFVYIWLSIYKTYLAKYYFLLFVKLKLVLRKIFSWDLYNLSNILPRKTSKENRKKTLQLHILLGKDICNCQVLSETRKTQSNFLLQCHTIMFFWHIVGWCFCYLCKAKSRRNTQGRRETT